MRFFICSQTFGNTPMNKVFELVSSAGYTSIDLTAVVDSCDWIEAARLGEQFSLEISGLTCHSGFPAEDHDLANKQARNREKAVDYFKRQIGAQNLLGVTI